MQEGDYKGSIDTVLLFGMVYMILCSALVSKQFDSLQTELQILASGGMLLFVIVGFLYFRITTSVESLIYLLWRSIAYLLMALSSILYVFLAIYESADNKYLFYVFLNLVVGSYFIVLWLRLKNTELNINSAIEDGRFGLNKGIDFSVDYRPLKTSIPLVSKWNKLANSTYNSKKTSTFIAIFGVLCIPLINTVIGAYLVGFVMVFMSLVSIRLLIHSTLDLLFYREIKRI